MNSQQIISALGEAWQQNNPAAFAALFAPEGKIIHPYFKAPIMPQVAMEVMNAAVKGRTTLKDVELLLGSGDGSCDTVSFRFEETGDEIGRPVRHVAQVLATAEIQAQRILALTIHGFEATEASDPPQGARYHRRDLGTPSARDIAALLAKCWTENDMDTFVSLFHPDGMVRHAVLHREAPPEVIADLMNSNVRGTTSLRSVAVLQGSGDGIRDVVEMLFDETGAEIGYSPRLIGTMAVTAHISGHRISALHVHGYHVADREVQV